MEETSADHEVEKLPALKRRKVRKGTQSCWECKRRKIRCTFATSTESICDGCRSRQVECVSQEFHEVRVQNDDANLVEALVEQVGKRAVANLPESSFHDTQGGRTKTIRGIGSDAEVTPTSPDISFSQTSITSNLSVQTKDRYYALCDALLAVWPSHHEVDLLINVTVGTSPLFHGLVCKPYSIFLSREMPSQKEILQSPSPESHPIFIARKLLMLGSFLQGVSVAAVLELDKMGVKCHEIMLHLVKTASRLVTSNDELVDSVEGVECLMIESMYQNNAGNLRRAWGINRRAMTMAQMMGLHLSDSSLPNMLDHRTRERIDPEYMWLRIVMSDRYLSLMLGLPQGSPENLFAAPKVLENCAPIERMERMEMVVGGFLIQRNRQDLHNLESTHEMDELLQDAAASMPAEWWLIPNPAMAFDSESDAFNETVRINNQFAHYHLLTQLHLPFILQSSPDRKYNYSKITAANASREILLRFVSLRSSEERTAYCRGIDLLAFIASITLCLAHIEARRLDGFGVSSRTTVFHFLAHQRLGDRGLMERTLQIMDKMVQFNNDAMARKIAGTLRRLLTIEETAVDSSCYNASAPSQPGEPESLYWNNANDRGDTLCITIPHFGTVKIQHNGVVRSVEVAFKHHEENRSFTSLPKPQNPSIGLSFGSDLSQNQSRRQTRQEASSPTIHSGGYQISGQSVQADLQAVPSHLDFMNPIAVSQSAMSHNEQVGLDEDSLHAGSLVNADDWALQGVDSALFDSLFDVRGIQL